MSYNEIKCVASSVQHANHFYFLFIALAIQPVENLTAVVDEHTPSIILKWDRPSNAGGVTAYDVRYQPSNSWWITPYHRMTVTAPATSVLLARNSGLHLPAIYNFEVRARDANCEGQWSKISEYNGTYRMFDLIYGC